MGSPVKIKMKKKGKPRGRPMPQNLKRTPKGGPSPNPSGGPAFGEISRAIRFILTLADVDSFEPQTVAERIALVRVKQSLKNGGLREAEFIADRAEGKPVATVKSSFDLSGAQVVLDIMTAPLRVEKEIDV